MDESPNWHSPGDTRALTGGAKRLEGVEYFAVAMTVLLQVDIREKSIQLLDIMARMESKRCFVTEWWRDDGIGNFLTCC
jgi:hypothetical protein